jgi:hypothetical protein
VQSQGFSPRAFCYPEPPMREDMHKVIVERPRRGKEGDAFAARLGSTRDIAPPMAAGSRTHGLRDSRYAATARI